MEELIDIEIEQESEEVRVYAWRVEQLGRPLRRAFVAADAEAELDHAALRGSQQR